MSAEQEKTAKPEIIKQPSQVILSVDKVDEISEYVAAIQAPNMHRNRYDTSVPFLVVPANMKVLDLEKHLPHPSSIRRAVRFTDSESFIKYVNEFKIGNKPQMFAKQTKEGLSIRCVFDYDVAAKEVTSVTGAPELQMGIPNWGTHIAQLDLTYSLDYAELREHNDEWFDQEDFALFVEENTHLFTIPSGADMFELAQDLKIRVDSSFRSSRRLSNGQVALQYVEQVNGTSQASGEEIMIPSSLILTASIFEGLAPQQLKAAFRFKKDGNAAVFKYKLMTKLEERQAHDAIRNVVQSGVNMEILSVSNLDTK